MNPQQMAQIMAAHFGFREDAYETALITRALTFVMAQTFDVKYPAMKARKFIPVDSSVPSGAEVVSYQQWDEFGMAKVIASAADDLPQVDVVAKEFTSKVKSLGDGYSYSVQEIRAAAFAGVPLTQRKATAARRAIEAAFDAIAAVGLPEAGMQGFVNNPNVPLITPTTGHWLTYGTTTTAAQILADIGKLVQSVITASKEVHAPDTILLDNSLFALMGQSIIGADYGTTLLKTFLANSPYVRNIDQWSKLNTADVAGTGPRIMAYVRDPEVVGLIIPQEFEQFPPQARNLAFFIACHARVGGVQFHYPLACAYMDGCGA